MQQSQNEKKMLDELFKKKSSVVYNNPYISSSVINTKPTLGTIEQDVAGRFGRWKQEDFRAKKLADLCISKLDINTVLDVGGGNLLAASYFVSNGKTVDVSDYDTSPYLESHSIEASKIRKFICGDFNQARFKEKYNLVWMSHILEHQLNIHEFLLKAVSLVSEGGYIAIAVPPRKPFIVSGHINLFNPGLLVYRLILAGVDCSKAKLFQYDGNICLLAKVTKFNMPNLNYDIGDIEILSNYFPFKVSEGFNGDIVCCNLEENEIVSIYEENSKLIKG